LYTLPNLFVVGDFLGFCRTLLATNDQKVFYADPQVASMFEVKAVSAVSLVVGASPVALVCFAEGPDWKGVCKVNSAVITKARARVSNL